MTPVTFIKNKKSRQGNIVSLVKVIPGHYSIYSVLDTETGKNSPSKL